MPRGLFALNATDPTRTVTWLDENESLKPTNVDNLDYVIRDVPDHVKDIIESIPHGDMKQINLVLKSYI